MVFVKVRETYDLKTVKDKMTVIGIHTPNPAIIIKNYPGLLMQCRAYRPVSCDVRVACASVLPVDPLGVGTATGDVAPEDLFNPILYKAMSNFGMSQLEAKINAFNGMSPGTVDLHGAAAQVDVDSLSSMSDEFNLYYGLLSNTHDWRHANPQSGLEMRGLKPIVYEALYNIADQQSSTSGTPIGPGVPDSGSPPTTLSVQSIRGNGKPIPFINCTSYSYNASAGTGIAEAGWPSSITGGSFAAQNVPWICAYVGAIIVPPSKLHELFYRMVIEWTIEFSSVRPLSEVVTFGGLAAIGSGTHFQNYSYSSTKEAVTGDSETIMSNDATMVSSNVDVNKVM